MKSEMKRMLAVLFFLAVIISIAAYGRWQIVRDELTTEVDAGLISEQTEESEPEPEPEPDPVIVDLMIFSGQSNMAGQGVASEAPEVAAGTAFEFRAVTDPTVLYPIEEPFGLEENLKGGIYDIWPDGTRKKLGDLIPAFVNKYTELTGHVVVAVSASECGTRIHEWLPETGRYEDLKRRIEMAYAYLTEGDPGENENFPRDYEMGKTFLLWCQGESDGDARISGKKYYERLDQFVNAVREDTVVDTVGIIRIGNSRDYPKLYDGIISAQTEYCRTNPGAVLISTEFAGMAQQGQMKDIYHYTQGAYNLVGNEAAENLAYYVLNGKEPTLWDPETDSLYEPNVP